VFSPIPLAKLFRGFARCIKVSHCDSLSESTTYLASTNMIRTLTVIVSLALLTGCANNHLKRDTIANAGLTPTTGILIGSFARNPAAQAYYSQTFYFKDVKTNEVREIKSQPTFNIFSGKTPDDFNTEESNGGVFAFNLPAGQYVFFNFRLYQANGFSQQNWRSKEDYSIPFEVRPNTANYVGEIKLNPVTGKNIFGMSIQAGGTWSISNQMTRDVSILKRTRPEVVLDSIVSVIPDRKDAFTPLVVLPKELEEFQGKQRQ
jgi:hypothetical protein